MKQLLTIFLLTITAITSLTLTTPQIEATTTNLPLTFIDNDAYNHFDGTFNPSFSSFSISQKVSLPDNVNTLITNNFNYSTVLFWNNSTYLGYYGPYNNSSHLANKPNTLSFTVPNNTTHFAFFNNKDTDAWGTQQTFSAFQNLTVSYNNPTPYTIEQKNPYYDQLLNAFQIRDYPTVFVAGTDYTQLQNIPWNYGSFWWDDNGVNMGTLLEHDVDYANRVAYMNLVGEHLYLDMPLPANITEAGTYDLWFTLFDYDDNFKATYRPTSNNIAVSTLRDLGGYKFHLNYTENYADLPGASLFKIQIWRSETNNLLTFYDTDSTTLVQLHRGPTNEYQPGNNALWVDSANNTFDVRNYLTANNIALPTKEGHTLLGFTYGYEFDINPSPSPAFVFSTAFVDTVFYPDFEENITYDVTFTDYDDSVIEVVTVNQGETAIPTQQPTRAGYVFAYWEPPVVDIQGHLTTKAIYYVPITWRNTSFATIRIDQVIEGQMPSPPTLAGYTRTWSPTIISATEPTQYIITAEVVTTSGNQETSGVIPLSGDYSPISDLFGGVIGASIGAVMTLGTIDLYGIQLSVIIYLFVSMSLGLWILKAIRG